LRGVKDRFGVVVLGVVHAIGANDDCEWPACGGGLAGPESVASDLPNLRAAPL